MLVPIDSLYYPIYRSLAYKLYDPASIDGSALTAPPELSQLTYTNEYNLDVYSTQGNVMKVCKEGVEFQFASKRIESLKTRVTMYGGAVNADPSILAGSYS